MKPSPATPPTGFSNLIPLPAPMPLLRTAFHGEEIVHPLSPHAAGTCAKWHTDRQGWDLLDETEGQLGFRTRTSWGSWGEVFTFILQKSRLTAESWCSGRTQVVNRGNSRRDYGALAAGLAGGPLSDPRHSQCVHAYSG